MEQEKKTYEVEDLLTMLGGDQYYKMDEIMYVYHSLRGEHEEALYYKKQIEQNLKCYERKLQKLQRANQNLEIEQPKNDVEIVNMMEPPKNNIEIIDMDEKVEV